MRPLIPVVLVGPPGAGKSTIGRRVARALNCAFVDTDELIATAQGAACGEVLSRLGEPRFREMEAECVAEALSGHGVVSLGGGAVLTESTRTLLDAQTVVWIDVSAEEGSRRTYGDDSRPLLAGTTDAEAALAQYRTMLEARAPLYREVADFRVRSDRRRPAQAVADILGFLESQ